MLSLALAWPCYAGASGASSAKICLEALLASGTDQAGGDPLTTQDLEFDQAFKQAYSSREYSAGECHQNVYLFLKGLRSIDAHTQVLYLEAVDPQKAPLYLFNVREEESPTGYLSVVRHFVVLRKRRVYDFAHKVARPLSLKEFFAQTLQLDSSGRLPAPRRDYDWVNSVKATTFSPVDHLSYSHPALSWQSPSLSRRGWMGVAEVSLSRIEGWELFNQEKQDGFSDSYFVRQLGGLSTREALERHITCPAEVKQKMTDSRSGWEIDQIAYDWMQSLPQQMPGVEVVRRFEMLENFKEGVCTNWLVRNIPGLKELHSDSGKPPHFFDIWGLHTRPVAFANTGDIVVYLNSKGRDTHVGIVARAEAGKPVLVDSKWGTLPAVFRHPIDYVPSGYGDRYAVFRLEK